MIRVRTEEPLRGRALMFGFMLAALVVASLLLTGKPAHATDFVVTNTNDSEAGSLRQAILAANAASGADTIKFNIPGSGVKTISPTSALPDITDTVTIDGYTQPGTKKNTLAKGTNAKLLIELNGENAGPASGLRISPPSGKSATGSVVRGLVINRFLNGISLVGAGTGIRVEGNFLGTDASGTLDRGNGSSGIFYNDVANSTIGGTRPDKHNLISGNGGGIGLGGFAFTAKIEGNLIGTSKDGTSPLGNDSDGVTIFALRGNPDPNNVVGGETAAAANTIAFNGGNGVRVAGCGPINPNTGERFCGIGNSVLRNSIFSNGELGIDLERPGSDGANGVTANDPGDVDDENDGPNLLQNFPELNSAKSSPRGTAVKGTLNSTPDTTFTLRFFSNLEADSSGHGEGQRFLGKKVVATDSSGNASFTFKTKKKVPKGQVVTATATDPNGNTSEFSAVLTVS